MRLIFCFSLLFVFNSTHAQSVFDNDLKHYEGFFDFYYDSNEDKIYLEVIDLDSDFLYVNSLSQGVGSNDLGLDRGQLGRTQLVYFHKAGNKLLLIQPNLDYRAISNNKLEKRSVEQAFAKSVLYGFPIVETTKKGYLIDLSPFLLQDAHDVVGRLKGRNQGSYSFDKSRSALYLDQTKAFPKNVEFEVLVTLKGKPEGREIRSVTPNAKYVTTYQHHSFIELPDDNYVPRKYNKKAGGFSMSFADYAAPIDEDMMVRYAIRHRLEKKNPNQEVSEAVEPIIYYLDNGTPEPVRSALLDGARWWNEAFEAIGFKDAFQVKILPEDADPLDVRYNVIQWVHRSTRGWSYGGSVVDPRTGEIIKGHVSLGSLRVRQDYMIAQALSNAPFSRDAASTQPMMDMALARIRQLSAHEIGHTIGLAHNFSASVNDRASVMDYPHPQFDLDGDEIKYDNAYAVGIGAWDKVAVAYAYSVFSENEEEGLNQILNDAQNRGLRYISDSDARAAGGANAYAHLWDNGKDPVTELQHVMAIRSKAISQFSIDQIKTGESLSRLEDIFVPVYFMNRYQNEAAVKWVAGIDYTYKVKGDGAPLATVLPPSKQRNALNELLETISANALAIPKDKLALFPARGWGDRSRESFGSKTGVAFDPLGAAGTASDFTLRLLLHPERVSRLVQQHALDPNQLGLKEMLNQLTAQTWQKKHVDSYLREVQHTINGMVLQHLMMLAQNKNLYPQAKIIVEDYILQYKSQLKGEMSSNPYAQGIVRSIDAYFDDPSSIPQMQTPKIPDGSPIGMSGCNYLHNE